MNRILVYGMTDNLGGIETYLINELDKLKGSDVTFDFVTDFPTMAYDKQVKERGSKIYYIPAKGKGLVNQWRAFWQLLRNHPEYQIIYFNILDAGAAMTMVIPWLLKRTIITHSHNGATTKVQLHKICKPFLKIFTKQQVACSSIAADFMFGERSRKETLIIPNAIDVTKYEYDKEIRKQKRHELNLEEKFVVCHIGRLSYQKNPKGMIDIFEQIYKKDSSAVLLYIGSGELEDEIHEYAKKSSANQAIRFLGKRNDIAQLLQASDVFVLPSFYEGLPIVAIEAQAAGLTCILSENITREANITGLVQYLALEKGKEYWSDEILKSKGVQRKSTKNMICEKGYDLHAIGKDEEKLQALFMHRK